MLTATPEGVRYDVAQGFSPACPHQSLAHCVCEPPALAGAVASIPALASGDGLCGRKKLPFAGYSVVKESCRSYQLSASRCQPEERRLRGELLSKLLGSCQAPAF